MYNTTKRSDKHTVQTGDGSLTLYSAEFDEYYHSTHAGALHESLSKHVIPALTLQKDKDKLTILDICFGLGYNTLATIYYLQKENLNTQVHIISPEFDEELVHSLRDFEYPPELDSLKHITNDISQTGHYEDEQFRVDVLIGDAREIIQNMIKGNVTHSPFDIIYQDAFSPDANPSLWTKEWFSDLIQLNADDAILTTYSIAAAVRMGLHENKYQLYELKNQAERSSLIASPSSIDTDRLSGLEKIDMELKIQRNPDARSLRDWEIDSR
jgi:tRNA U34 5-methylaminomethyl-2-thiouridine-forming methyltransferase MnmC